MNVSEYTRLLREIHSTEGLFSVLEYAVPFLYNRVIRSRLPEGNGGTIAQYHGVDVAVRAHPLDDVVPFAGDRPGYERALIRAIRRTVSPGDHVVHVGGGFGVAAVESARASEGGRVVVFEGAREWAEKVSETASINGVGDVIDVRHGTVTEEANLKSDPGDARSVSPTDLPHCDVLVLDCEGAESTILEALSLRPRHIVVETHGWLGSPTDAIHARLQTSGYDVVASYPAHAIPDRRDQYVLIGTRTENGDEPRDP
ncbi:hypothetical protein ACYJ1Y_02220 [Natrialbaceae archaeon A-gly3]